MLRKLYFITLLLSVLSVASVRNAGAALTLVSRETFQGVGTLNTANPGNLGTVTGSFYKRPVGPKISGDSTAQGLGWSADLQLALPTERSRHFNNITSATATAGMISGWYYCNTFSANGSNPGFFIETFVANTNALLKIGWNPTNGKFIYYRNQLWTNTDSAVAVPVQQWFELRQQWTTSANNCTSLSADYRLAGSSTWTSIYTTTTTFGMGAALTEYYAGQPNRSGQDSFFRGRYGMAALYTMDSWSDRLTAISDVVDPPAGPFNWYVNPSTGSDTNDGLTSGTAWASVSKINNESQHCGMFPASTYASGDTLTIDTTSANLVLGTASLNINTPGLNVVQLGGGLTGTGEIQAWKQMTGSWTQYDSVNYPNIWQQTLSETNLSCVLWEDDKWMNHPTGAAITNVRTSLNTTPGSFWTDGTTMYLNPFGNTNPNSDGKVYTRSYHRGSPYGASAVNINVNNARLSGLRVRKTCLADKSTNDPVAAYCFQQQASNGGTGLYENCYGDYGSKHVFGFIDNGTTRFTTVNNCQAEQGSPYGAQSPWVDYSSASATSTSTTTYNNCTTNATTGLVGSLTGKVPGDEAWLSHNNGSSNFQFATIAFNNCNLAGAIDTYGAVQTLTYTGGSCAEGIIRTTNATFSKVRITNRPPSQDGLGTTAVRNSIITYGGIASGFESVAQGTVDYQGCVIDMRNTTSNGNDLALFKRSGSLNLIWKNNLFIGSPTYRFGILNGNSLAVTPTFSNNAYILNASTTIAYNYNDGSTTADRTLAQWQALGFGTGSITPTLAASIGADYKPISGSPLIDAGTNLGPLADYTGTTFATRNDIGAYEFLTPIETWRVKWFSSPDNSGPGADDAITAGDGLTNLVKYALGLDPGLPAVIPAVTDASSGYLRLTVAKNPAATDLTYSVERATDLSGAGNWSTTGVMIEADTATLLQACDATPLSDETSVFLRLRIERP